MRYYTTILATFIIHFVLLPLSLADVEITTPNANTKWAGGSTVEMKWKDNGGSPALDEFSTFNVYLCWGSNDVPLCDQVLGPPGSIFSASSTSTKFLIPAAAGESGNVYFLKMETVAAKGGFTVNYSPRFTLTSMTGTFLPAAVVEQKKGDISPPQSQDTTKNSAAPADGGKEEAKVPYTMQTGPTRYAPIQTQPGHKITAQTRSRMFPTSAYTVFKTKGSNPVVQTTITMSWDYKVTSLENNATPAPHPEDPMQRFLNRWKD
ncbi:cell wall synthesis protein KRE9/KNH1-domain-containing protein [Trichophaea hybrida]|nr:cell wall synthesis protein KRE9/KNH1-domain-containing protein [Trichophaea hybrida]